MCATLSVGPPDALRRSAVPGLTDGSIWSTEEDKGLSRGMLSFVSGRVAAPAGTSRGFSAARLAVATSATRRRVFSNATLWQAAPRCCACRPVRSTAQRTGPSDSIVRTALPSTLRPLHYCAPHSPVRVEGGPNASADLCATHPSAYACACARARAHAGRWCLPLSRSCWAAGTPPAPRPACVRHATAARGVTPARRRRQPGHPTALGAGGGGCVHAGRLRSPGPLLAGHGRCPGPCVGTLRLGGKADGPRCRLLRARSVFHSTCCYA
jgi:hypothetical protein